MADAAILNLSKHIWYLTEELLVFGLWDEKLPNNEKQVKVRKLLLKIPPANYEWIQRKPNLPANAEWIIK